MESRKKPLAGIRVIDTADDRGEFCGRLLADLGADVIRVEPPDGATSRHAPPWAPDGRTSLYFAFRNAGKRGITLDLFAEDGPELFHRLLDAADVWIESCNPGVLGHRGLAPAEVVKRHPFLVVTSISDFGQSGPHRDFLGTDMIGNAMGGVMYRAGAETRPPVVLPGSQAYDVTSVTAAFATLTALWKRFKTGRGQTLDVSVQEAMASIADWTVPLYSTLNFFMHRGGSGMYPVYRCADGWLRLIVMGARHWRALRAWMGEPEELRDPVLETIAGRVAHHDTICQAIQCFFSEQKRDDAVRAAQERGIAATPVLRPSEVLSNEHSRARRTFVDLELVPGQKVSVASGFFEFDGVRLGPTGPPPALGEQNHEVFEGDMLRKPYVRWDRAGTRKDPEVTRSEQAGEIPESPFAGIRVLDFGVGVAGVEAGRLLADYGAEVIKIESSKAPDFVRLAIPGLMNGPFASANRGKMSFGVDLKNPEGLDLVRRLVKQADVVVENSGGTVMERLGLGYADLTVINPEVIMFSTQMAGSHGPWRNWIGYGPNNHTLSGLQYLWNYPEDSEKPAGSTNIHPDHLVGRVGALGVVAALIRRERGGGGTHVDVAQFETVVQLLGDLFAKESLSPGSVGPQGNRSDRGSPWGAYPCLGEDEWCVINVRNDTEWTALREALGRPEWASKASYDTVEGRREACEDIGEALGAWMRERSPAAAMELLQAHGVPAGMVQHPEHQVRDPHLAERGFFEKLDQVGLGEVVLEGVGFFGSDIPKPRARSAPLLGEHTRVICRSLLGLSDSEVDGLVERGVLEEAPQEGDR